MNVVDEEYRIDMSNPSNANKWKYYMDKAKVQFQVDMNFNGLEKVIYKGLENEINNNWSVQGVTNAPNNISETTNKSDTLFCSQYRC